MIYKASDVKDGFFAIPMVYQGRIGHFITDDALKSNDKGIDELLKKLENAKKTMLNACCFLTCDPEDMKNIEPDFCCEQYALDVLTKGIKELDK